jgi:hypothetical protein
VLAIRTKPASFVYLSRTPVLTLHRERLLDTLESRGHPGIEGPFYREVKLENLQYRLEIEHTTGCEEFAAMRDIYIKVLYSIITRLNFVAKPILYAPVLSEFAFQLRESTLFGSK